MSCTVASGIGYLLPKAFATCVSSLMMLGSCLELNPTPFCTHFLRSKDKRRVKSSVYKSSEGAKKKRRAVRRKRKRLDDKQSQKGVMYSAGAFVGDEPGPSKRSKAN